MHFYTHLNQPNHMYMVYICLFSIHKVKTSIKKATTVVVIWVGHNSSGQLVLSVVVIWEQYQL